LSRDVAIKPLLLFQHLGRELKDPARGGVKAHTAHDLSEFKYRLNDVGLP
jgi:hypothetical protein